MLVEFSHEELPKLMTEGLDEWVKPPELVESLEI
jgi:hypothetical protein